MARGPGASHLILLALVTALLSGPIAPAALAGPKPPGSVGSAIPGYDPATDQGSPYNVARRIALIDGNGRARIPYTGKGVQIALIDTGVVDVPGLRASNVKIGPDFSFEDSRANLRARDTNGHGTHLAGIMVASDQAWLQGDKVRRPERVLGVAPDAQLVSIKVAAADGTVDVSQVIAAINWVIANRTLQGNNIRVINLAFGTDSLNPYLTDPLAYAVERAWRAGIVVVVAAGNDGSGDLALRMPAADPFVIAVGSSETASEAPSQSSSSFSSDGNSLRTIDVAAPGRSIVGLRNPGSYSDGFNQAGRVGDWLVRGSGTSQAAAVVSGAVALLLEGRPQLTPDQVKKILIDSARVEGGGNLLSVLAPPARYLDVAAAASTSTPRYRQTWLQSSGVALLEGSRGSIHVYWNGVPLVGELDIFGRNWTTKKWTVDSWTGLTWSGSTWSGSTWSGSTWSGNTWSGNTWSGNTWSGSTWSGNTWSGNTWSGSTWSGSTWSGNSWSGSTWSDHSWS